jgi:orotate phosphoribosyltransferase
MMDRDAQLSDRALEALMQDVRHGGMTKRDTPQSDHAVSDDNLFALATGSLQDDDRVQVQQHVNTCQQCASRIRGFKRSSNAWDGPAGESRLEVLRDKIRRAHGVQSEIVFGKENGHSASAPRTAASANFRKSREDSVLQILNQADAIERNYDYALPDGLHTNVHINLGKVCKNENDLKAIVGALDQLLSTERFDTVVSTGWAVGTIARRLIWRRRSQRGQKLQHVRIEGYDPPNILDEVHQDAEVILLVDVVVTGRQVSRAKEELRKLNARSIKAFAVVDAEFSGKPFVPLDGRLCAVSMKMVRPENCDLQKYLPLMEFNPVAGHMTKRRKPRSPSQFLAKYRAARELWDMVDTATAYEHHRIVGKRHYVPFIDTHVLLKDRKTGPRIAENLCRRLEKRSGVPDVVLVPTTAKAKLLGTLLVQGFQKLFGVGRIRLEQAGHSTSRRIGGFSKLRVLVADVVTAHGDTLDELAFLSLSSGAERVTAAVVLSRMSEACESALNERLNGHFVKLYSLPIRPVTVRDGNRRNCFLCQSRQTMGRTKKHRFARHRSPLRQSSLSLTPLTDYRLGVISGITLHALNAAKNNGMAPLSLPEITSNEYPSAKKAALVRYLPPGTLQWSGSQFREQLLESLRRGDKTIWLAVVEYLERENSLDWLDCLAEVIESSPTHREWMDDKFWKEMNSAASRLVRTGAETGERMRFTLESIIRRYQGSPEGIRFQQMLAHAFEAPRGLLAPSETH